MSKAKTLQAIAGKWNQPFEDPGAVSELRSMQPASEDDDPPPESISHFVRADYISNFATLKAPPPGDPHLQLFREMEPEIRADHKRVYGVEDPQSVLVRLDAQFDLAAQGREHGYDTQAIKTGHAVLDRAWKQAGITAGKFLNDAEGPPDGVIKTARVHAMETRSDFEGPNVRVTADDVEAARGFKRESMTMQDQEADVLFQARELTARLARVLKIRLTSQQGVGPDDVG